MLAAAFLLALASGATPTPGPEDGARVPAGGYGGQGIALRVAGTRTEIELNCARGAIDGPIRVDAEGRFDVAGTYERGRPGPTRMDEAPQSEPARYRGRVDGETLTLEITFPSGGKTIGPLAATFGRPARIHACL